MSALDDRQTSARAEYRPEIDGLRAVAILGIILYHFEEKLLPGGFMAVDLFFVISGVVITQSLASLPHGSAGAFLAEFYTRRIRRLLPAMVCFVVPVAILITMVSVEPVLSLNLGLRSLFGISNFYLLEIRSQYFSESARLNAFTHTWSLGLEEQFYLIYPAVAYFLGIGKWKSRGVVPLIWFLSTTGILSCLGFIWLGGPLKPAAYFLLPTRFWEFSVGCLVSLVALQRGQSRLTFHFPPMIPLALILVLFFTASLSLTSGLIATVVLSALLVASLRPGTLAYRILTTRFAVYVGRISYSLYLWHWAVLALSRWTVGVTLATAPIQIILMGTLAHLSFQYVERPLRHRPWSVRPWRTFAYGFGALAVASLVLILVKSQRAFLSLDNRFPTELVIGQEKAKFWGTRKSTECQMDSEVTKEFADKCLFAPAPAGKRHRLILLGDSHASQYRRTMEKLMPGDWDVRFFTSGWGCGIITREDAPVGGGLGFRCSDYLGVVDEFLKRHLLPEDVLLITQLWRQKRQLKHLEDALTKVAEFSQKSGATLILLDDDPGLNVENPILCEKRPWRRVLASSCVKTVAEVIEEQKSFDEMRERIRAKFPSVLTPSLRTLFCEANGLCGLTLNGKALYSDSHHLTREGTLLPAQHLVALIRETVSPRMDRN